MHPLFRRSRLFEAAEVADVVERRLAQDPGANVAILVQGRSHLVNIVAELARRGVPFQATDIDPLGERPVVLDLLALTRAIAHPADRPAWLATLRAPWCGLTLAELYSICGDSRDSTLPELLRDPERHARIDASSRARLGRAWKVLAEAPVELRRFGLRDAVERAWLALAVRRRSSTARELDEAQAYFDELAELERRAGGPIDLAKLAEALEKLYAPSRPDKSVRVELMTVHKAKGLQFDTVIVPGLERRPRADDKRLLQWARVPGAADREIVVAPIAGTGADPNRLYRWLEGIEADKLREEKRRLLYVAATRAKRWLHLFGTCQLKAQPEGAATIVRPTSSLALGMLWPVVEDEFQARLAEAGAVEGESTPEIARDPPLRRLPLAWRVPWSSRRESSPNVRDAPLRRRPSSSTGRRRRRVMSEPSCIASCSAWPAKESSLRSRTRRRGGVSTTSWPSSAYPPTGARQRSTGSLPPFSARWATSVDAGCSIRAMLRPRTNSRSPGGSTEKSCR